MIGVGRFLRSRFLKRLFQRDAGNEPRPQEAANVQFSHRLVMARFTISLLHAEPQQQVQSNAKIPAPSSTQTGCVSTHASSRFRSVSICNPVRFAAIVPAIPGDNTCVVLTGSPI